MPCHTIHHFMFAFVDSCTSTAAPPPPHLSPLLASSAAWRIWLLSTSPLCHLAMQQSTAPTTPRYHLPFFSATVDHYTVSAPNGKGGISMVHSVASTTLRSAARHWAHFFPSQSGLTGTHKEHAPCRGARAPLGLE